MQSVRSTRVAGRRFLSLLVPIMLGIAAGPAGAVTQTDLYMVAPTGFQLSFPDSTVAVFLAAGPASIDVLFPGPIGEASDGNLDGRDDVSIHLASLALSGTNATLGPITITSTSGNGEIEEISNPTPGILDVAPFTASGVAYVSLQAYFEVSFGGKTYTAELAPLTLYTEHVPMPALSPLFANFPPLDLYEDISSGFPTGIRLGPAPIPEPASLLLLGAGVAAIAGARSRARLRASS